MKVKSVGEVSLFGVADQLLLHHVTSAVGTAGKVSCELQCGCTGIECMFTGGHRGGGISLVGHKRSSSAGLKVNRQIR